MVEPITAVIGAYVLHGVAEDILNAFRKDKKPSGNRLTIQVDRENDKRFIENLHHITQVCKKDLKKIHELNIKDEVKIDESDLKGNCESTEIMKDYIKKANEVEQLTEGHNVIIELVEKVSITEMELQYEKALKEHKPTYTTYLIPGQRIIFELKYGKGKRICELEPHFVENNITSYNLYCNDKDSWEVLESFNFKLKEGDISLENKCRSKDICKIIAYLYKNLSFKAIFTALWDFIKSPGVRKTLGWGFMGWALLIVLGFIVPPIGTMYVTGGLIFLIGVIIKK
jgi:hypothetical protein